MRERALRKLDEQAAWLQGLRQALEAGDEEAMRVALAAFSSSQVLGRHTLMLALVMAYDELRASSPPSPDISASPPGDEGPRTDSAGGARGGDLATVVR